MDDSISRQVVAKFLDDWLFCLDENCHKQSASDLKMIIKDFKNLPSAQPEQRWIPCSERLPEDFKKVLVFWWEHSEPMIDTAFWQKDAKRFDGQHWVRIEDKITHWMPLPEPARLEND